MATHNYIKLQNQGNIVSNLRLSAEMESARDDFADENGYFSKRKIAQIAACSLLVTSGNSVGQELEALWNNNDIDEGRNSLLQNAKARMQILRTLGLVSADYNAEMYAITDIGKLVLQQTFGRNKSFALLRELFMSMTTATEVYEFNCDLDFDCYIGYEICYALANLDYKISTKEMPCITTYSITDIQEFIDDAKAFRSAGEPFPSDHPHAPRRQNGQLLANPSNLTRSINQILRVCGILEPKPQRGYYVCTNEGRDYVDAINRVFKQLTFLPPYKFRKLNLIDQKQKCKEGLDNLYRRGDINITQRDTKLVFSPYQLLPEACVQWLMEQTPRKPPVEHEGRINVINEQITASRLRLHAIYGGNTLNLSTEISSDALFLKLQNDKLNHKNKEDVINELLTSYKPTDKSIFYPFIHSLLRIIGLHCDGEVGRYDAYCTYNGHIIPVEIKSYTETPCYNLKGLRQAVENKICSYDYTKEGDLSYSSVVVGFNHPDSDEETIRFIGNAKEKLGINIIACNTESLVKMAVRVVWDNLVVDLNEMLRKYGIINE